MPNIPAEYLNVLATQFILIAVFLGGFSATLLATIISSDNDSKYSKAMVISSALSALTFVICVMSMTGLILYTTKGYPLEMPKSQLTLLRSVGGLSFLLGIISFTVSIGLSGWLKSRKLGITTTIFALITVITILAIS